MQKRHSALKFFTSRPLVAAVAMLAGLLLTGIADTSIALAATCNTADFEQFTLSGVDGRTTYAVTKNLLSWNDAQALATASGGRLATIVDAGQNEEIATKLGSLFTPAPAPSSGNKAWIGLRDLANTGVWSLEGADIQLTPDRFSWASGASNYTNYTMDQPDDYCTLAEKQVNPDRICYGEPWVTIESFGAWSDEGDHGSTPLKLKGVVEWPNNILDCVKTTTPPTVIPDETLPGTENGALFCKDQTGLMLAECVATTDSGKLCPLDKLACEPVNTVAKCPTGSTLNTERDMCQADHLSVRCPASYTWDSSIDRCVLPPTCAGGGVFNTITDRCETLISQDCPAGYTFNQGENKCTMDVVCADGGTYNPATDRCEKSQSGTCDNGFTLNSTSGLCEKEPTCPAGTTYNATYNKCISDTDSVCPVGYVWSDVRARCEKTPECGTGAAYSPVSGKCESESPPSTSNYAAVQGPAFDTPFPLYFTGGIFGVMEMGYVSSQAINLPTVETYTYTGSNPPGPFTVGPFTGTWLSHDIVNYWGTTISGAGYAVECQRGPDYLLFSQWYPSSFCGETDLAASGCTSIINYACGFEGSPAGPWTCGWDGKFRVLGYNVYAVCGHPTTGTLSCPTGGTLSGTTCVFDSICADGSTPIDNVCQVNPTCTGGSFDTNTDTCFVTPNPCTDPGTTLDTALGRCTAAASCTPGVLDTAQDKCTVAPTSGCTAAYPLDPVAGVCASPVVCTSGVFVPAADRCEAAVGDTCSDGYVFEPLINKCTSAPTCPTDIDFNMGEIILFSTEIDKCAAVPLHSCGADLTWMSTPYNKCEAIPVCDSPGVYSNTTNTCSAGVCPAGGTCKQIVGDTTLAADGSPMTWCSPDQCQDDTAGMITGGDIPPQGINDLTDDGAKNEDGTCAGQIYIFNGRDMRCTKDDMRGMIGSIAKIIAIIVASVLTAGALAPLAQGLAVAMASATSVITPAAAMAISTAVITSAVTSIMNLGIDAATVGVDGQAWAIQSSISLVSAGVMAYLGGAVTDGFKTIMRPDGAMVTTQTVTQTLPAAGYDAGVEAAVGGLQGNIQQGSLSLVSSTAGGTTLSTIGTYVGEPLIKTSTGIWQQIKDMGTSLSNNLLGTSTQSVQIFTDRLNHTITTVTSTLTTSPTALAQSLYYAQQIGAVVQPAINAGMMASYQTKKCCNPDAIAASCEASEIEEWSLVEKGNCHRVGTYCDTKFLGMCMAHKETSCCFASKLARIIHEQGRPQLQAFGEGGGWGSPESPRCRGFTPDEFQMVDFGQLNLDEYVADLTAQIQQVGPGLQNYMDSVSSDASNRANTLVPAGE